MERIGASLYEPFYFVPLHSISNYGTHLYFLVPLRGFLRGLCFHEAPGTEGDRPRESLKHGEDSEQLASSPRLVHAPCASTATTSPALVSPGPDLVRPLSTTPATAPELSSVLNPTLESVLESSTAAASTRGCCCPCPAAPPPQSSSL